MRLPICHDRSVFASRQPEQRHKSLGIRISVVEARLFQELRGFGYDGSYDAVRRYAISWRRERGTAMAQSNEPLAFVPTPILGGLHHHYVRI